MLGELLAIAQTDDFEHNGWIRCERTVEDGSSQELDLRIRTGVADQDEQVWRVVCSHVRTRTASLHGDFLALPESHPVLLPYHSDQVALSFRGRPHDVDAVIGALWRAHKQLVGNHLPFERHLNTLLPLWELLTGGFGRLAEGPLPLIEAYADALRTKRIEPQLSRPTKPKWYGPKGWAEESGNVKVLLVGSGHVIAERFEGRRVE